MEELIKKIKAETTPENRFHGRILTVIGLVASYIASTTEDVKIKSIAGSVVLICGYFARQKALKVGSDENK